MRNTIPRVLLAEVVLIAIGATQAFPQEAVHRSKPGFQLLSDTSQLFSLEYPKKDWQPFSGVGPTLLTLAQKNGEAVVAVEHTRLNLALAPDEISDLLAQLEADAARERNVNTLDLQAKIVDQDGRRLVVVEFQRRGVTGTERVRQYSFPMGQDLYRLICGASVDRFAKYEPMFVQLARSFKPGSRKPPEHP
jgi:hypothetical protein